MPLSGVPGTTPAHFLLVTTPATRVLAAALRTSNHPGYPVLVTTPAPPAPPLLNQEGSFCRHPSSNEGSPSADYPWIPFWVRGATPWLDGGCHLCLKVKHSMQYYMRKVAIFNKIQQGARAVKIRW